MQKINAIMNLHLQAEVMAIRPPMKVGPKGRPLAAHRFQDQLPVILKEFEIKAPQDRRLWSLAKTDFWKIESKVAYVKEQQEIDFKKTGQKKALKDYAGLLLWLIFTKK